jgi:hypothetical protein
MIDLPSKMTDFRLVVDFLVARLLWLAMMKGVVEPVAAFWGRKGYQSLDKAMNDVLPNLPEP